MSFTIFTESGTAMIFERNQANSWIWVYGLTDSESMELRYSRGLSRWVITDHFVTRAGRTPQEAYENLMANYQELLSNSVTSEPSNNV